MQPDCEFLTYLAEIAPQGLCLVAVPGGLEGLVEWEARFAGEAELLEGAVDEGLLGGFGVHVRLDLGQTVGDEQDAVDQHAVCGALDLKVAEERVGPEQRQDLVQTVVRLRVRVHVQCVRARRQRWQRECRPACFRAQWEEREVSCACERACIVSAASLRVRGSVVYLSSGRPGLPGRSSGMPRVGGVSERWRLK